MAKTTGHLIEAQLQAARARMMGGHFEGSLIDGLYRLEEIRQALNGIAETGNKELLRYFPVAVIAVLETHFKTVVKAIVDSGSPYLERGLMMTKDRLKSASDFFPILHRGTVTVGELVAHQLPFNSIASIEEALNALLEGKLKNSLAAVCDPLNERAGLYCSPIVEDIDGLWRDLALTFEQRHILAHEAGTNYRISADQANTAVSCVTTFAMAIDALLWATVWKDRPLLGTEMRDDAQKKYSESRVRLAVALLRGRNIAKSSSLRRQFYQLHREWRVYADRWARWEVEEFSSGTIRYLVAPVSQTRLVNAREKDILEWCSWFESA